MKTALVVLAVAVVAVQARALDDYMSLLSGAPEDSWIFERNGAREIRVKDEALVLTERAGLIRTKREQFGDFDLRFETRAEDPSARPWLVIFGRDPFANLSGSGAALWLLDVERAKKPSISGFNLTTVELEAPLVHGALTQAAEWHTYSITRRNQRLTVMLNGVLIFQTRVNDDDDGWFGLRTRGGAVALRQVRFRSTAFSSPIGDDAGRPLYKAGENGVTTPRLIRESKPSYTRAAMNAKVQGEVHVEAVVDTDGEIRQARVVRSLDPTFGLDESALIATRRWKFAPATLNGRAVPTVITVALTFSLR